MQIIDGKEVAASLRREIAAEVAAWVAGGNRTPHLVAILVGNDGASQTYVGHKEKCCGEVGFRSTVLRLPEETSEETLLGEIARLNADPQVDGFIVQLPLPKHISGTTGDRSDRSEEGCRRFSSGQYRADDLRTAVLSAGHAGRDSRIAKILRDRNRRTALRRDRPAAASSAVRSPTCCRRKAGTVR